MERVNKEYVKLDKFDLLCNIDKGIDSIKNLLSSVYNYEKDNKYYIGEFYLSINSKCYSELAKFFEFPIKRNTLLNTFIYAGYTKNLEMVFRLNPFITLNEVSIEELGSLSNYILEHGISFDEYLDKQEKRLIFDENLGSFYKNFIYDENTMDVSKSKVKK